MKALHIILILDILIERGRGNPSLIALEVYYTDYLIIKYRGSTSYRIGVRNNKVSSVGVTEKLRRLNK